MLGLLVGTTVVVVYVSSVLSSSDSSTSTVMKTALVDVESDATV